MAWKWVNWWEDGSTTIKPEQTIIDPLNSRIHDPSTVSLLTGHGTMWAVLDMDQSVRIGVVICSAQLCHLLLSISRGWNASAALGHRSLFLSLASVVPTPFAQNSILCSCAIWRGARFLFYCIVMLS